MTEQEAQQRCAERQRACPPGDDRRFLARELGPGVWGVVQLRVGTPDADEPPDPRSAVLQS